MLRVLEGHQSSQFLKRRFWPISGLSTIHWEWYLARFTIRRPDLGRIESESRWNVVGKNILPVHIGSPWRGGWAAPA